MLLHLCLPCNVVARIDPKFVTPCQCLQASVVIRFFHLVPILEGDILGLLLSLWQQFVYFLRDLQCINCFCFCCHLFHFHFMELVLLHFDALNFPHPSSSHNVCIGNLNSTFEYATYGVY